MGNGDDRELGEASPAPAPHAKPSVDELQRRFFFQKPRDADAIDRHEQVSLLTFELAQSLCLFCYPGRQLSLALTALEEVRMRANASIACDDPRPAAGPPACQ